MTAVPPQVNSPLALWASDGTDPLHIRVELCDRCGCVVWANAAHENLHRRLEKSVGVSASEE